jgi:hypothetical protein
MAQHEFLTIKAGTRISQTQYNQAVRPVTREEVCGTVMGRDGHDLHVRWDSAPDSPRRIYDAKGMYEHGNIRILQPEGLADVVVRRHKTVNEDRTHVVCHDGTTRVVFFVDEAGRDLYRMVITRYRDGRGDSVQVIAADNRTTTLDILKDGDAQVIDLPAAPFSVSLEMMEANNG